MNNPAPNETAPAVSDWFMSREITGRMLRTLDRIGPGGLIVADLLEREFRVIHARTLTPATHTRFIVFGYDDLAHTLPAFTSGDGELDQEGLVAAVDCTVWEGMDQRVEDIAHTSHVITCLREHMQRHGFDLNGAPEYHDVAGRRTVTDFYAHRTHPHLAVNIKAPSTDTRAGYSVVRLYDHNRHVTGWPCRIPNQFEGARVAHRVRTDADAYLRRTRP
ncbi:hypothetical protein DFP74_0543 [Nocardiopsis sp. Huas11]|uniref:hypothetical protein n=1 Tax=Nocardiopsis sp. Huas11 TaxID=2183912 RepID=UPI000F28C2C9|nr:hypothetical protein [Nocardiopsis sp. Huas11]RKS04963.1 hypothetical protein DFP74_0543 [Nocardiopsis sp. Huas11]